MEVVASSERVFFWFPRGGKCQPLIIREISNYISLLADGGRGEGRRQPVARSRQAAPRPHHIPSTASRSPPFRVARYVFLVYQSILL